MAKAIPPNNYKYKKKKKEFQEPENSNSVMESCSPREADSIRSSRGDLQPGHLSLSMDTPAIMGYNCSLPTVTLRIH
jgi:hypothetical protein